jgi:hypothetical protein
MAQKYFFDSIGHERRFRPVRRISAYLLTAAEKQTSANRCLGPILLQKSAVIDGCRSAIR